MKNHIRLVSNMIYVQMSHEAAEQIANHALVANVNDMAGETLTEAAEEEFKKYPFHKTIDANGVVSVPLLVVVSIIPIAC